MGFTSGDLFLTAELSALEAAGEGEVVSQPKVITGDKQQASIKSGTEVPYQESSARRNHYQLQGCRVVAGCDAQYHPDDRIMLDLQVNQDSIGELVPSGQGGFIPPLIPRS